MQRLLRMPFAIKNHTRRPIWSDPGEDDQFNIYKKMNQRASATTATIFDVIFFALWAPVARFPTNRRFFKRNGRISRIVLRGIYATNELNATIPTTEMKKLSNLQHFFFLAGFFAFIAWPTLFNFIEKAIWSSYTLIFNIIASSVTIVATSIS